MPNATQWQVNLCRLGNATDWFVLTYGSLQYALSVTNAFFSVFRRENRSQKHATWVIISLKKLVPTRRYWGLVSEKYCKKNPLATTSNTSYILILKHYMCHTSLEVIVISITNMFYLEWITRYLIVTRSRYLHFEFFFFFL